MRPQPRRVWLALCVATPMTLGALPGCPDDGPANATLTVRDAGQRGCSLSASDHLAQPVAVGARLTLIAEQDGARAPLSAAIPTGVFAVHDAASLAEGLVTLVAVSPGDGAVTLDSASGDSVHVPLTAAEIAATTLSPWDVAAFNLDEALEEPHPAARQAALANGLAVTPGGRVRLDVTHHDAGGRDLIGYGAVAWEVAGAAARVSPAETHLDDAWVHHDGVAGASTVSLGTASVAVTLLEPGAALQLAAYIPRDGTVVSEYALVAGDVLGVVARLTTADGLLVVGDDGAPLTAALEGVEPGTAASAARIALEPPWHTEEDPYDGGYDATLREARVTYVEALAPGTATLTLSVAGQSLMLPLTITAP